MTPLGDPPTCKHGIAYCNECTNTPPPLGPVVDVAAELEAIRKEEEHHELRIHNIQIDVPGELTVASIPYCPCGWVSESGPASAQEITDAYREHLT